MASTSKPSMQAMFTGHAAGCTGGHTGGLCSGGTCAVMANRLCIYASGTQKCPTSYPTASTPVFSGIMDNRTCSPCQCAASGTTCAPTLDVFSPGGCFDTTLITILDAGTCETWGSTASTAQLSVGAPDGGSCSVQDGGAPGGSAIGMDPITVCCLH